MTMRGSAAGRGLKVIIAGAGGAAHLPGMAASMTRLPVLGVPVETKALKGLDSLLSIVQMPAGMPVGTLAIGKAGAVNAGLLAAAILATGDEALADAARGLAPGADRRRSPKRPNDVPPGSTIGIIGGGQLGRMLALAAAQLGYRCHVYAPDADSVAARGRGRIHPGRVRRRRRAAPFRRRGRRRHLRVREYRRPDRSPRSPSWCRSVRRVDALEIGAGPARARRSFIERLAAGRAPSRAVDDTPGSTPRSATIGTPAILKTRRFGYDGKGQVRIDAPRRGRGRLGGDARRAVASSKRWSASTPNSRSCSAAASDGEIVDLGRRRGTATRAASSSPRRVPAGAEIAGAIAEGEKLARRVADALDHVGVLAMEFFAVGGGRCSTRWRRASTIAATGRSRARAPRNSRTTSGRFAACRSARPTCTAPRVEMANLVGDEADGWREILADPAAHLHLYGKSEARPGRKMGHVTRLLAE